MRWLFPFGIAFGLWAPAGARADGLIHRVPDDGAWAVYQYQQGADIEYKFGEDSKLSADARKRMPQSVAVVGFFTMRSVGEATVEGKKCRWIELEQSVKMTGKTVGGTEAEAEQRTIVLKLLIPEERLKVGEDPLRHAVGMKFKDGDHKVEEIVDPKRRQYELDRFRPLFPEPAKDVKRIARQPFAATTPRIGKLECEHLTFPSKYDGPLSGGQGRWTYEGDHQLWLSDRIPFGVAGLEFTETSKESYGLKDGETATMKGTRRLVIADYGTGAKSRIPDVK